MMKTTVNISGNTQHIEVNNCGGVWQQKGHDHGRTISYGHALRTPSCRPNFLCYNLVQMQILIVLVSVYTLLTCKLHLHLVFKWSKGIINLKLFGSLQSNTNLTLHIAFIVFITQILSLLLKDKKLFNSGFMELVVLTFC